MRILFVDSDTHIFDVVEATYFGCEPLESGRFDVFFIDFEGEYWHTSSMCLDEYKQYSYDLSVRGYVDLRSFVFSLDKDE